MKKKYYIWLGLIVVVAALLYLLWPRAGQTSIPNKAATLQSVTEPAAPSAPVDTGATVTPEDLAKTPWVGTEEHKRSRISEVRDVIKGANQPIVFYGKVIDQDGAPLPSVRVRLNITRTEELLPGTSRDALKYIDLVTDAQGLFGVNNDKGSLLMVESLFKTGYEAPYVGNRPFWYAPPVVSMSYAADKNNPEVFRMWKLQGAEKLLNNGIGTRIPYDGKTVYFDLIKERKVASGGDIKVTLSRTPLQIKRGQEKYDWTATIEAIDGGVIVSTDEFMYRAPESGYEPKLTISVSAKDPNWSADKAVSFYLKSRGTYARVQAEFMTDSEKPETGFRITAYINPSGSRNLEYDPLQGVAKP